jgi:hypothetical protein
LSVFDKSFSLSFKPLYAFDKSLSLQVKPWSNIDQPWSLFDQAISLPPPFPGQTAGMSNRSGGLLLCK